MQASGLADAGGGDLASGDHGSRSRGQLGDGFDSGSQGAPGRIGRLNDFVELRRSRPVLGVGEFGPVVPLDLYLPCVRRDDCHWG